MPSWKSVKLLPKIRKYFGKLGSNNKAVVEAAKAFDKEKASIEKEIEERKADLEPKIVDVYRDSKPETKMLLKEPSEARVKEQTQAVETLLQKIVEAGCPGATTLKDASEKVGVADLAPQINYLLLKISPFVASEEAPNPPPEEPQEKQTESKTDGKESTETEKVREESKAEKPKGEEPPKVEAKETQIVGSEQKS